MLGLCAHTNTQSLLDVRYAWLHEDNKITYSYRLRDRYNLYRVSAREVIV